MTIRNRLSLDKISKTYFTNGVKIPVLNNITYEFAQGTGYAITGASGSGKSTLLHIVGGIDDPTDGSLSYNDRSIAKFEKHELEEFRRHTIGFMFQNHYLIGELTILENVALAHRILGNKAAASIAASTELLAQVGLTGKEERFAHELSGGQQQRAALARALINRPTFLLADEPTGNLDADTAKMITDLLLRAKHEWNLGIIVCTHDNHVAEQLDVKLCIEHGALKSLRPSAQP